MSAAGVTLLYSIAPRGATMVLPAPSETRPGDLVLYDTQGAVRQTIHLAGRKRPLRVHIARRSYALSVDAT